MPRDPGYDFSLRRLKTGPVTARNRFHRLQRCTGTGWVRPRSMAEMRSVTARGGWEAACTDAVRLAADETVGADGHPIIGDRREIFAVMAEMPDLRDNSGTDCSLEMGPSRFTKEGAQEPCTKAVRPVTTKPVVAGGQCASADAGIDALHNRGEVAGALPFTLCRIADCEASVMIAAATRAGHRSAQDQGRAVDDDPPVQHERIDACGKLPVEWRAVAE